MVQSTEFHWPSNGLIVFLWRAILEPPSNTSTNWPAAQLETLGLKIPKRGSFLITFFLHKHQGHHAQRPKSHAFNSDQYIYIYQYKYIYIYIMGKYKETCQNDKHELYDFLLQIISVDPWNNRHLIGCSTWGKFHLLFGVCIYMYISWII